MIYNHRSDDMKVTLSLQTTISSPRISLSGSQSNSSNLPTTIFQIHTSIKHRRHAALPVALSRCRTPLERPLLPGDFTSPVWVTSALTYFRSTSNPDRYGGPPKMGYRVHRRRSFARNLREDWDFITIPSMESGNKVTVEHRVPIEKLQFWEKRNDGHRDELTPIKEEKWVMDLIEAGWGLFGGEWEIWTRTCGERNLRMMSDLTGSEKMMTTCILLRVRGRTGLDSLWRLRARLRSSSSDVVVVIQHCGLVALQGM